MIKWPSFFARLFGATEGVSAVEFALVSPVFILILVGIIDLGAVVRDKIELSNAAATAARYVLNENYSEAFLVDVATSGSSLDSADITATVTSVCGCSGGVAATCGSTCADGQSPGTYMVVSLSKISEMILTYPGFDDITISGQSRMRLD